MSLFALSFFNKDRNHITPKTEDNVKAMASIITCGRYLNIGKNPLLDTFFISHPLVVYALSITEYVGGAPNNRPVGILIKEANVLWVKMSKDSWNILIFMY